MQSTENTVKKIIQNDVVHEDSEDMANMFNDYFVEKGKILLNRLGEILQSSRFTAQINQDKKKIQTILLLFHRKNNLFSGE